MLLVRPPFRIPGLSATGAGALAGVFYLIEIGFHAFVDRVFPRRHHRFPRVSPDREVFSRKKGNDLRRPAISSNFVMLRRHSRTHCHLLPGSVLTWRERSITWGRVDKLPR